MIDPLLGGELNVDEQGDECISEIERLRLRAICCLLRANRGFQRMNGWTDG